MTFELHPHVQRALAGLNRIESLLYGILAIGCLDVLMGPPPIIPESVLVPFLAVALGIRACLLLATAGTIALMNDSALSEALPLAGWLLGTLFIAVSIPSGVYLYGSEQTVEALAIAIIAIIAFVKWMTQYELEHNGTTVIEG